MPGDASVILMGLRGSGKSTLGAMMASRLARPLIDLDDATAAILGASSAGEAFRTHGQSAFRVAEAQALRQALARPGIVLALGGGTPTAPGAADLLQAARSQQRDLIVYLHAAPDELRRRLSNTDLSGRPALIGDDPLGEIERVYAARDGLYRSLAGAVVEVAGGAPEKAAARIVDLLRASGGAGFEP